MKQGRPSAAAVSVIGPGGGTGINSSIYAELGRDPRFVVEIVGRSRAPYDCYPEAWPHGGPPPNLGSFAEDVLRQGWAEKSDCFVFGSRGGQVVLPILWQHQGDRMPPCVCINGGCAMNLPQRIHWPNAAITFLLLGGQDYFKGNATTEEYLAETKSMIPAANGTTAILFVNEMQHMPQGALLGAVLPHMLRAILAWKETGRPPLEDMRLILAAVNTDGWSGRLLYTKGPSDWATEIDFGPFHVARHTATDRVAVPEGGAPIEMTKKEELKALFRAAAVAAKPGGGAPLAPVGARFAALAEAAKRAQATPAPPPCAMPVAAAPSPLRKTGPTLPIPVAGTVGRAIGSPCGYLGSPGHGEARTPNRLPVPHAGRSPMCEATPISRALGLGRQFHSPSPSHASSPYPSPVHYMGDGSPSSQRSPMAVR